MNKFKIGDLAVHKGLVGKVQSSWTSETGKETYLNLESVLNPELACSANEEECVTYNGEPIDQVPALRDTDINTMLFQYIFRN